MRKSRFTIANRVADHALDIMELIVSAIYSPRDICRQRLNAINRRLEALRILFRICFDRQFISAKQYTYISERIDEAGRMVEGWLKSL
ncbi:MAG: four helix bundle protein [Bacteroidota bacterium]